MTVELRANMVLTADGKDASAELQRVTRDLGDAKVQELLAADAAKKLKASQKDLTQSTAEYRNELAAAVVKQIEAQRVSQAAQRSYDEFRRSLEKVTNSAAQQRAAMTNLGQQIGDITQGLSMGVAPATIFTQQAGQVAFALQGMGGAASGVAAFLSGPWGIALTVGLVALSPWIAKLFEGDKAAKALAEATRKQKEALEEYNRIVGIGAESEEKKVERQWRLAKAAIAAADATRVKIAAELDAAIAERKVTAIRAGAIGPRGEIATLGLPVQDIGIAALQNASAENERKRADNQKAVNAGDAYFSRKRIAEATDAAAAANGRFERTEKALLDQRIKGLITRKQYEEGYRKALDEKRAALDAIKDATKAEAAALRDAKREAKELADAMERLASLEGRNSQLVKGLGGDAAVKALGGRPLLGTSAEQIAASQQASRESGLADSMAISEARVAEAKRLGEEQARSFYEKSTAAARDIGGLIGQAFGSRAGAVVSSIGQLGFGTKDAKGRLGDFTGIGAQLKTSLVDVFGNRAQNFADKVGKAAGGAATGSVISGIGDALGIKNSKAGAQIGGAIGSFIPGGEIIGSILGGLFGGLFGSRPKGSTTISSTGGSISQSSTGDKAIAKATGVIGNSITDALTSIAQLGADIGTFSVSIGKDGDRYRVDTAGRGRTKKNNRDVIGFDTDEGAAIAFAIADALKDGAIKTSPRVQAALTRYGDNVNRAVAEALKVKSLEDLLADRSNPFTSVFRNLELQLKQRVQVAKENGFDLVEIERINGEDRAKALKDTLADATGSIRTLLNDLQFGSRATGSPTERLAGLISERDRLGALARGGDQSAIDAFASIIQQIDDLQKETFGKTAGFATGRANSISLLNDLVKTTEDRINAAASQAQAATETTNAKLTEANATLEDIYRANLQTNQGIDALTAAMQAVIAGRVPRGGNANSQFVRVQ